MPDEKPTPQPQQPQLPANPVPPNPAPISRPVPIDNPAFVGKGDIKPGDLKK